MVKGDLHVLNKHFPTPEGVDVVINVMRPSILGNPFKIKKDGINTRDYVIDKYKEYFAKEIKNNSEFSSEIHKIVNVLLSGKTVGLQCCCHPAKCHADIIKDFCLQTVNLNLESSKGIKRTKTFF